MPRTCVPGYNPPLLRLHGEIEHGSDTARDFNATAVNRSRWLPPAVTPVGRTIRGNAWK